MYRPITQALARTTRTALRPHHITPLTRLASTTGPSTPEFPDWSRKPPVPDDPTQPDYLPLIQIPRPVRPASEPTETKRARLVYASRKRGILETDLILSTFARDHLGTLTREELIEYDDFLEENDWDIYYWVTGTPGKIVPQRVKEFKVFPRLVEHAKNKGRRILRMPDLD
ncbi:Flavinator of succinate dehydrogenase-domain-containing protein [Fimicolochytrium jonesii]|uniref:Flavinator of succinate dehydrogenase-domain-containing protein n=1 Tax=Fimicolochytrium jonesii TaxID=1396493 RepID=UPI0022FDC3FC|nr:Flavinator of succinate dehydrogenase-domain-containing protein [Fimicolochytrium jonesii]KAI8820974.1 Flavinator of succinate dehydrogenase-domain-containing protein [Fimicolochytrium jonesii]